MKTLLAFVLFVACLTSHAGPTYAQLNRRFDRNRITEKQSAYLWTLEQVNLIKPELRGTGWETTFLSVRGLNDRYSGDPSSPEWCVLNRAGRPVRPRAEFLRTEVNLISADAPEWQLRTETNEGYQSTIVWVLSGSWRIEARTVGFGFVWQFVRRIEPGETVTVTLESDPAWGDKELRVVAE